MFNENNNIKSSLGFGDGKLNGSITLEYGSLSINFLDRTFNYKVAGAIESVVKINKFDIDMGHLAIEVSCKEEIIDIADLFEKKGINYNEALNLSYSKYAVESVKKILSVLKSEFLNIVVGYYTICENPSESEIEYVIDKNEGVEVDIEAIFNRIMELQRQYSVWIGIIYLWIRREYEGTEEAASIGFTMRSEITHEIIKENAVWM